MVSAGDRDFSGQEMTETQQDEQGSELAQQVALAYDQDPALKGISTVYVSQTESAVVLVGSVPNQAILDHMVAIAMTINGTTTVDTRQVTIG